MKYLLHKISLSGEDVKFRPTKKELEYEVIFENCVSTLNFKKFLNEAARKIEVETFWGGTGERIKDTISLSDPEESPNFPEHEGYRVYPVTWASGDAIDRGFFVLKCK